jgi:hypothetical protein
VLQHVLFRLKSNNMPRLETKTKALKDCQRIWYFHIWPDPKERYIIIQTKTGWGGWDRRRIIILSICNYGKTLRKIDRVLLCTSKEDSICNQIKLYIVLWYAVTSSMCVHIKRHVYVVIWCPNENFVHIKTCVMVVYSYILSSSLVVAMIRFQNARNRSSNKMVIRTYLV